MPENNNMQEAVSAFDRAIHLKPDFAEAYNNRGFVKGKLGQHRDAVADFDRAIHLKPDFAEAYNNRGTTKSFGKLGDYAAALADYDRAIRLKTGYASAYFGRGMAKKELGHTKEARDDFKIALDLADRAGDDNLKAKVEQLLQKLDDAD